MRSAKIAQNKFAVDEVEFKNLSPAEKHERTKQEAEETLERGPIEYVDRGFHNVRPPYKHLSEKFINGVAELISEEPEKFFAAGLHRKRSIQKFLDNSKVGFNNMVVGGVRRILQKLKLELDPEYAEYVLMDLKLHRVMMKDQYGSLPMSALMKPLRYAIEFSGLDTKDPRIKPEYDKLVARSS